MEYRLFAAVESDSTAAQIGLSIAKYLEIRLLQWQIPLVFLLIMTQPKVSYFFISREKLLLEWYSEKRSEWVKSAVFFFSTLAEKKNTALFLTEKKIPGYFSAKLSISDRKKQRYFSKLSTPIFLPKLWITDEKTKITFWPKLGISDGNKKIPPYFCKNCLFLAEIKKYPLFLPKPSKSCAGKKKIPRPTKRSEWVPSVSFPGKKKIRHLWMYTG